MVKYVLTGATGILGSRVLKELLQHVPASDIAVSIYNPSGPTDAIRASGVEIRHGDYTDPSTLATAFAGAEKLLLISYPAISYTRIKYHKAAIDAAKAAGVKHVYYTSLAYESDTVALVMRSHLDTEAYLKESGMAYTIVREGAYNETWPLYLGIFDMQMLRGKDDLTLYAPIGDGGICWASQDDLGVGTAKILAAESGYENATVFLTGSKATTLGELVSFIGEKLQRKVILHIVPEEPFIQMSAGKLPEETVRGAVTTFHALVKGDLAVPYPLLKDLLGREPTSVKVTIEEMLSGKQEYKMTTL